MTNKVNKKQDLHTENDVLLIADFHQFLCDKIKELAQIKPSDFLFSNPTKALMYALMEAKENEAIKNLEGDKNAKVKGLVNLLEKITAINPKKDQPKLILLKEELINQLLYLLSVLNVDKNIKNKENKEKIALLRETFESNAKKTSEEFKSELIDVKNKLIIKNLKLKNHPLHRIKELHEKKMALEEKQRKNQWLLENGKSIVGKQVYSKKILYTFGPGTSEFKNECIAELSRIRISIAAINDDIYHEVNRLNNCNYSGAKDDLEKDILKKNVHNLEKLEREIYLLNEQEELVTHMIEDINNGKATLVLNSFDDFPHMTQSEKKQAVIDYQNEWRELNEKIIKSQEELHKIDSDPLLEEALQEELQIEAYGKEVREMEAKRKTLADQLKNEAPKHKVGEESYFKVVYCHPKEPANNCPGHLVEEMKDLYDKNEEQLSVWENERQELDNLIRKKYYIMLELHKKIEGNKDKEKAIAKRDEIKKTLIKLKADRAKLEEDPKYTRIKTAEFKEHLKEDSSIKELERCKKIAFYTLKYTSAEKLIKMNLTSEALTICNDIIAQVPGTEVATKAADLANLHTAQMIAKKAIQYALTLDKNSKSILKKNLKISAKDNHEIMEMIINKLCNNHFLNENFKKNNINQYAEMIGYAVYNWLKRNNKDTATLASGIDEQIKRILIIEKSLSPPIGLLPSGPAFRFFKQATLTAPTSNIKSPKQVDSKTVKEEEQKPPTRKIVVQKIKRFWYGLIRPRIDKGIDKRINRLFSLFTTVTRQSQPSDVKGRSKVKMGPPPKPNYKDYTDFVNEKENQPSAVIETRKDVPPESNYKVFTGFVIKKVSQSSEAIESKDKINTPSESNYTVYTDFAVREDSLPSGVIEKSKDNLPESIYTDFTRHKHI